MYQSNPELVKLQEEKSSGHRVQDVEISYNYIGILPAALLYDLQNGKTA